jgi:hypothetical protein
MAFKMKKPSLYSSLLLRNDNKKKKKEIKDNIIYDEQYDIFYDEDIQRSYEQQRGRFAPKRPNKNNEQDTDRLV